MLSACMQTYLGKRSIITQLYLGQSMVITFLCNRREFGKYTVVFLTDYGKHVNCVVARVRNIHIAYVQCYTMLSRSSRLL